MRREVLVVLCDVRFVAAPGVAGASFAGHLLCVGSWAILFVLPARRATAPMTIREFRSGRRFAAPVFAGGPDLQRAAGRDLLTGAIGLAFSLVGLRSMMKGFG